MFRIQLRSVKYYLGNYKKIPIFKLNKKYLQYSTVKYLFMIYHCGQIIAHHNYLSDGGKYCITLFYYGFTIWERSIGQGTAQGIPCVDFKWFYWAAQRLEPRRWNTTGRLSSTTVRCNKII